MSRISVSCGYYLKDTDKGYRGIKAVTWNYGSTLPLNLRGHILLHTTNLSQFFYETGTLELDDIVNQLIDAGDELHELAMRIRQKTE